MPDKTLITKWINQIESFLNRFTSEVDRNKIQWPNIWVGQSILNTETSDWNILIQDACELLTSANAS